MPSLMKLKIKNILIVNAGILLLTMGFVFLRATIFSKLSSGTNEAGKTSLQKQTSVPTDHGPGFAILWWTDFSHNRVLGFDPQGKVVWAQNMSAPPIPQSSWYFIGGIERVTVAPNGNLITSYGDGMMVQEIDRQTHGLVWQYGIAGLQTYRGGMLDEPHKAYKFNDHEVVINDSNDREVIVVDQNTNQVVWQYGQYHVMSGAPGFLRGNTSVLPLNGGQQFLITDTLQKKLLLVDRATKNILWQWTKPDSQWMENVSPTPDGSFVLADRIKGEVFEVNRAGQIVWDLTKLSDENRISYPTDTAVLDNGNVLIAEAGRNRIVEADPQSGKIIRQYLVHGFVSTVAVDQKDLNGDVYKSQGEISEPDDQTIAVQDEGKAMTSGLAVQVGPEDIIEGKITDTNPSTGKAGALTVVKGNTTYGVEVYNYSRVVDKDGAPLSLIIIQKGDHIYAEGTLVGTFLKASFVKDESQ
jgi:outer membrane protein assembly factor BamB